MAHFVPIVIRKQCNKSLPYQRRIIKSLNYSLTFTIDCAIVIDSLIFHFKIGCFTKTRKLEKFLEIKRLNLVRTLNYKGDNWSKKNTIRRK